MVSILLIDDDEMTARLLQIDLRDAFGSRARLFVANTLAKGLLLLTKRRFDHVLLDNRLPPFADYRQTLPIVRLCARGIEPMLVTVSPRDRCFDGEDARRSPRIIDKFRMRAEVRSGLFGEASPC